jgi:hypothetical protein
MDNELLQKQALVVGISASENIARPTLKKFLYGRAFCDM